MATNLFAQAQSQGALVTFKAGKMERRGNMVHPDARKGQIVISQSISDGLVHFQWKDRHSGNVEDDLITLPDSATFTRVAHAKGGRVYALEFKGQAERTFFYWMQEPKEEKDEELIAKVNKHLQSGPAQAPTAPRGANSQAQSLLNMLQTRNNQTVQRPARAPAVAPNQVNALEDALRAALGQAAPAAPTATQPAIPAAVQPPPTQSTQAANPNPPSSTDALSQALIAALSRTQTAAPPVQREPSHTFHFRDLVHGSSAATQFSAILDGPNGERAQEILLQHLPPMAPGTNPRQHILDNVQSPQMRQAADLLEAACTDPEAFQELTRAFQLPNAPDQDPHQYGTDPFIRRIEHANSKDTDKKSDDSMKE